jgi:hypothetical protein
MVQIVGAGRFAAASTADVSQFDETHADNVMRVSHWRVKSWLTTPYLTRRISLPEYPYADASLILAVPGL